MRIENEHKKIMIEFAKACNSLGEAMKETTRLMKLLTVKYPAENKHPFAHFINGKK